MIAKKWITIIFFHHLYRKEMHVLCLLQFHRMQTEKQITDMQLITCTCYILMCICYICPETNCSTIISGFLLCGKSAVFIYKLLCVWYFITVCLQIKIIVFFVCKLGAFNKGSHHWFWQPVHNYITKMLKNHFWDILIEKHFHHFEHLRFVIANKRYLKLHFKNCI